MSALLIPFCTLWLRANSHLTAKRLYLTEARQVNSLQRVACREGKTTMSQLTDKIVSQFDISWAQSTGQAHRVDRKYMQEIIWFRACLPPYILDPRSNLAVAFFLPLRKWEIKNRTLVLQLLKANTVRVWNRNLSDINGLGSCASCSLLQDHTLNLLYSSEFGAPLLGALLSEKII